MESCTEKYDSTIREELDKADWGNVLLRVLKYAQARAKKFFWLGASVEPEEMVHEAIARAYGIGENDTFRNWNTERYPKLEDFLISIIDSMTSHRAEKSEKFKTEPLYNENGSPKDIELSPSEKEIMNTPFPASPEEEVSNYEEFQIITDKLKNIAQGDDEMEMVILCIEEGISKPMNIAQETGYDIKRVYSILRRLRERLKKIKPNPRQ